MTLRMTSQNTLCTIVAHLTADRSSWSSRYTMFQYAWRWTPGATLSIISHQSYDTTWQGQQAPPIKSTDVKLHTYTGEGISVDGEIDIEAEYQSQKFRLTLLIVAGDGPSLLGHNWLCHIGLTQLYKVFDPVKEILDRHSNLFKEELSKITGTTAKLYLKSDAQHVQYLSLCQDH